MTMQYSVAVRNARLASDEVVIGEAPILEIRSGAPPANCAAADTGTLLASITLPTDWADDPADGVQAKLGTWEDASANANGTAGHFRVKNAAGTVCHIQGTVTATGGGGDMTVDNTSFASGQPFTVETFTRTAGNA